MLNKTIRFNSVDALRGLTVAAMLLVNNAGDWDYVYPWLEHATWHGSTPADFIFPFFLIIVGVSLHLALAPKLASSSDQTVLATGVLSRALRIIALGLILHLIAHYLIPGRAFRLMGVLQRIGICFLLAGLVTIYVRKASTVWGMIAAILVGYWSLLSIGGSYEPHLNLADRIDTSLLGSLAYSYDAASGLSQEPEGILSTLPALATVLFGVQAGALLRVRKVQMMIVYGLLAIATGALWSVVMPMNKQLWTSSFVLWTGGFAYLALVLAHYFIDLKGLPAIGQSFGINAISAYAGAWIATCILEGSGLMKIIYNTILVQILTPMFGSYFSSFAFAVLFTSTFGVAMWFLKRKQWRFSI